MVGCAPLKAGSSTWKAWWWYHLTPDLDHENHSVPGHQPRIAKIPIADGEKVRCTKLRVNYKALSLPSKAEIISYPHIASKLNCVKIFENFIFLSVLHPIKSSFTLTTVSGFWLFDILFSVFILAGIKNSPKKIQQVQKFYPNQKNFKIWQKKTSAGLSNSSWIDFRILFRLNIKNFKIFD